MGFARPPEDTSGHWGPTGGVGDARGRSRRLLPHHAPRVGRIPPYYPHCRGVFRIQGHGCTKAPGGRRCAVPLLGWLCQGLLLLTHQHSRPGLLVQTAAHTTSLLRDRSDWCKQMGLCWGLFLLWQTRQTAAPVQQRHKASVG